ncbi:MAG: hypothetical protein FJ088_00590 [Deltaproteobacteria bacterium]|nr:hypothetical protein [Deltaproteobacteria bacterium]
MKKTFFLLSLFLLLSCDPSEEQNAVRHSFNGMMIAFEKKDPGALYDISTVQVKKFFDYLLEKILNGQYKINTHYPENRQKEALNSICWDFAADAMTGKMFFVAAVDPGLIPDLTERMAKVRAIYITGSQAKVKTESGDIFSFVKDPDGVYRTDIFLKSIKSLEWIHRVEENLAVLDRNIELIKKGTADLQ